jgi:NAD(P)-dependent dehydrogenase (short-subunit alcohol dehydrogenase family)
MQTVLIAGNEIDSVYLSFLTSIFHFGFEFDLCLLGASKGIALALTDKLLQSGGKYRILAACRDSSSSAGLKDLQEKYGSELLHIFQLDVNHPESHKNLKVAIQAVGITTIDIVISNAAVVSWEDSSPLTTTPELINTVFQTNVIGAMLTLQTFADMTKSSPTRLFIVISSILASIEHTEEWGLVPSYSMSKAAINSFACLMSTEKSLKEAGCKFLCIHPGSVKTTMNPWGTETVEECAKDLEVLLLLASEYQLNGGSISTNPIPSTHTAFVDKLSQRNCVFVSHNGSLIEW